MTDLTAISSRADLLEEAIRFLMELGEAERAVVLNSFESKDGLPAVKAVYGFEPDEVWSGEVASRSVFKRVLRDGKPLLAADARRDVMLGGRRSVMNAELVSILAVPFGNADDEVAGLLYADARLKVANFDYSHLKLAEDFAHEFGRRWFELPPSSDKNLLPPRPEPGATRRGPTGPPQLELDPATSRNGVIMAVVSVILLLLMCTGPSIKPPPPKPTPLVSVTPVQLEARPYGLAKSFLDDLQNERVEAAHKLLSSRLHSELKPDDLLAVAARWKREDLGERRRIMSERVAGDAAAIEVGRPGAYSKTWYFIKEQGKWKLDRFDSQS